MADRSFSFVLGAGASASSSIPTGAILVDRWLRELKEQDTDAKHLTIEEWATSDLLQIEDFNYVRRAEFYPRIYNRRFGDDSAEGYAALEHVMQGAEPSLGYSFLAKIMVDTARHNIVITTNFDNLVADSVLLFTNTFALVVGHESLTEFIRIRRPGDKNIKGFRYCCHGLAANPSH